MSKITKTYSIARALTLLSYFVIMYVSIIIYKWYYKNENKLILNKKIINDKEKNLILPKELLKELQTPIASITIILTIINSIVWISVQLLYHFNYLSYKICLLIWIINIYIAFTSMHDATHNAIATKQSGYNFLNGLVGRIASFMFAGPYPMFRLCHLKHHKYTNIPSLDPDHFSISGSKFILPFKWHLQIYKYLIVYLSEIHNQSILHNIEFITYIILPDYIQYKYPQFNLVLVWLVPSWIATTILAFIFNYIPHRDTQIGIYRDTHVTSLYGNVKILTIPLLCQNYHNIHHIYPYIPFYKYSKVWYKINHLLLKKGTQIRSFLPIF
eukprot:276521_1